MLIRKQFTMASQLITLNALFKYEDIKHKFTEVLKHAVWPNSWKKFTTFPTKRRLTSAILELQLISRGELGGCSEHANFLTNQ